MQRDKAVAGLSPERQATAAAGHDNRTEEVSNSGTKTDARVHRRARQSCLERAGDGEHDFVVGQVLVRSIAFRRIAVIVVERVHATVPRAQLLTGATAIPTRRRPHP